jgi:signal transduction histidine kinase
LLIAIEHLKKAEKSQFLSYAYNSTAIVLKNWGNFIKASEYYMLSIQSAPKDDSLSKAMAYYNLSVLHNKLKDKSKALGFLEKTESFLPKSSLDYGLALINYLRAAIYFDNGDLQSALIYYNKALDIAEQNRITDVLIAGYREKSIIVATLGDTKTATELVQKSHDLSEKLGYDDDIAMAERYFGEIAMIKKQYSEAIKYFRSSAEVLLSMQQYNKAIESLDLLIKTYDISGNHDDAYKTLARRSHLADSIYKADVMNINNNLETQLEIEKQLDRINKMEQEKKESEEMIAVQQRNLLALLIFSIVFLAGLVVFSILFRKTKRLNRSLEEKNKESKEQRIKIELQYDELNKQKKKLDEIVNDLKNKEIELLSSNNYKDHLLSIIAHDLKGPIQYFQKSVKIIMNQSDKDSYEDKMKLLNTIFNQAAVINELLQNLLRWTDKRKDKLLVEPIVIELKNLIEHSVKHLINNSNKKQIEIPEDYREVFCDINIMSIIIRNLTSNALKSIGDGGYISYSLELNEKAVIKISDSGKGMSEELIKSINAGNYSGVTEKMLGAGIGIMICKELIALHGGDLIFEPNHDAGVTASIIFNNEMF